MKSYILLSVDGYDEIPVIDGVFDSLDALNKYFTDNWFEFQEDLRGKVFTSEETSFDARDKHGYRHTTYYSNRFLNEIE